MEYFEKMVGYYKNIKHKHIQLILIIKTNSNLSFLDLAIRNKVIDSTLWLTNNKKYHHTRKRQPSLISRNCLLEVIISLISKMKYNAQVEPTITIKCRKPIG